MSAVTHQPTIRLPGVQWLVVLWGGSVDDLIMPAGLVAACT